MDDQDILDRLKAANTRNHGFNLLVRKYQERVYWLVRKMVIDHEDANDLTQDVFVKVWRKIGTFRGDSQLYTWVYRIAVNECLHYLKKKRKRFFLPINDLQKELANKIDHGAYISGDDIQKKLQKALLTLPDKQKLIFTMRYFDDMSYEEIAQITKTSVGSLKAGYHHAVKKIEHFIKVD